MIFLYILVLFIKKLNEILFCDILMFVKCNILNYWLVIYDMIDCGNWINNLVRIYIFN